MTFSDPALRLSKWLGAFPQSPVLPHIGMTQSHHAIETSIWLLRVRPTIHAHPAHCMYNVPHRTLTFFGTRHPYERAVLRLPESPPTDRILRLGHWLYNVPPHLQQLR